MANRQSDLELLEALHLRDTQGLTAEYIGARIGRSRSAVLGIFYRIKNDEVECLCTKPENKNGGMKPKWWKT